MSIRKLLRAISQRIDKHPFWTSFFIFCPLFFLNVYLFWPGFMSFDSVNQYAQAISGRYDDWHPPLLSFLENQISYISDIPQGLLLFQLLLIWLPFLFLYLFLQTRVTPSRAIFVLIFPYFPSIFNFSGVLWKDVHIGAACFASLVIIYILFYGRPSILAKVMLSFFAILLLFYAQSVRLNGAVLTFFCFLAIGIALQQAHVVSKKKWTYLLSLLIAIILTVSGFTLNKFISYDFLKAEKRYPEQYIQIYDLVGISYFSGQTALPSYLSVNDSCGFDKVITKYNERNGNPIFWSEHCDINFLRNEDDVKNLKRDWLAAILNNPISYAQHRLNYFLSFMRIGKKDAFYSFQIGVIPNDFGIVYSENTFKAWFFGFYQKLEGVLLYHTWVYLLLAMLMLKLCLKRPEEIFFVLLALGNIFYILVYFIVGPASDFRYVYPVPISTVSFFYVLYLHRKALPDFGKARDYSEA